MRQVGRARADRIKHPFRGRDVVALELDLFQPADLGLQHDDTVAGRRLGFPRATLGDIGLNQLHIGMQPTQDREIGRVLVDANQTHIRPLAERRNQILPDQACGPGDEYAFTHACCSYALVLN